MKKIVVLGGISLALLCVGSFQMIRLSLSQTKSSEPAIISDLPTTQTMSGVLSKLPSNLDPSKIRVSSKEYLIDYFQTLGVVTQEMDAIVVGRPTQDFIAREHRIEYAEFDPDLPNQFVDGEWTRGPFLISQVLYQKSGVGLLPNQTISLAEPVGLSHDAETGTIKTIIEECYEIKQNGQYVVFIGRGTDGTYGTDNFNLGRFNTDGSDCEDEIGATNGLLSDGTKTDKQKLREEITAQYGITFAPIGPCASGPPPAVISSARIFGRYRTDGKRMGVNVSITPPQPGNSMLEIESGSSDTNNWSRIANVPMNPAAQSGTAPVGQEVLFDNAYGGQVRCRLVSAGTPSAWSNPVEVIPAP